MADASTKHELGFEGNLRASKQNGFMRFIKQLDLQMMVLPGMLLIIVFSYLPMYGILIAFQDYKIGTGFNVFANEWVGFKHFQAFFNSPDFFKVMRNTLVISFLKLLIGFPAPILLALMLNEVRKAVFKRVIQTITYLPFFISWVIVGGLVSSMLAIDNGSVNILLQSINSIDEPINFLSIPDYFWSILISANVWKGIGFNSIVYMAAIASIDPHLYEAASIDGASRFKQSYLITLPCIMPVVIIFLILAIGGIMSAGFEDILVLAVNPVLREVSDVIDTYVLRIGITNFRHSYATAIGLFSSVVSVIMLTLANLLARRTGNSLW